MNESNELYTSIVKLDFQYAHRFMNWPREAKHLHGRTLRSFDP